MPMLGDPFAIIRSTYELKVQTRLTESPVVYNYRDNGVYVNNVVTSVSPSSATIRQIGRLSQVEVFRPG